MGGNDSLLCGALAISEDCVQQGGGRKVYFTSTCAKEQTEIRTVALCDMGSTGVWGYASLMLFDCLLCM